MEKKLSPGATTCHTVAAPRGSAGERPIRPRAGYPVRCKATAGLVATKRDAGTAGEPPVHGAGAEPVAAKPELEHGDVPPDRPDPEFALSEQRATARAERTPRRATDQPRRSDPVLPLEREAAHSVVSWPRTPSTGPGRSRGPGARPGERRREHWLRPRWGRTRGRQWTPRRQRRRSDACVAIRRPARSFLAAGSREGRGYNPAAAFPGSSIGRASGC